MGTGRGSLAPIVSGTDEINQGTISADVSGGTITVKAQPLVNQGTLSMLNGGSLSLDYLDNVTGLSVAGGGALTLNGGWTNTSALNVTGSTLNLNGSWANSGTISLTNSTVNLGGSSTQLGTIVMAGSTLKVVGSFLAGQLTAIQSLGAVQIVTGGTVDNTGTTVTLDGPTKSWTLSGGALRGGTVVTTNGASLVGYGGGTLDGVTLDGVLDLTAYNTTVLTVRNGLVLNGTALVGNPSSLQWGVIKFTGSQTLGGTGTVVFGVGSGGCNGLALANAGDVLTIGPGITVRGQVGQIGYNNCVGGPQNVSVINQLILTQKTPC